MRVGLDAAAVWLESKGRSGVMWPHHTAESRRAAADMANGMRQSNPPSQ